LDFQRKSLIFPLKFLFFDGTLGFSPELFDLRLNSSLFCWKFQSSTEDSDFPRKFLFFSRSFDFSAGSLDLSAEVLNFRRIGRSSAEDSDFQQKFSIISRSVEFSADDFDFQRNFRNSGGNLEFPAVSENKGDLTHS
jgi:hypothetical protein